jgi:3-oxoacyl-[acyl-carrier-protein] synthase II
MEKRPDSQRVVVTGLGAVSPLGLTVTEFWEGLVTGRSGIAPITQFDPEDMPTRIAGEVKGFDPTKWINFKEARRMGRATQMAVVAACEALADAGFGSLLPEDVQEEAGVYIGTAYGPFDKADEEMQAFAKKGWRGVSPFALSSALTSMPAFHVSLMAQAKGPIGTPINACAAGTQGIVEASEYIRRGHAQVMICGGVEGSIHRYGIAGFCAMRALSTRNDEPERASRPWDVGRDGFLCGEGAGTLILESLTHARQRGARILAEVVGYDATSDAYHITKPAPDGEGAVRAMQLALRDARLAPDQIDYVNAHGTSTPAGDTEESKAVARVFGSHALDRRLWVSSTKSMMGHLLGAAGAVEAAMCIQAIRTGVVPPTINLEEQDPECVLDFVPLRARERRIRHAMSNSFGFGGTNATLIVSAFEG